MPQVGDTTASKHWVCPLVPNVWNDSTPKKIIQLRNTFVTAFEKHLIQAKLFISIDGETEAQRENGICCAAYYSQSTV